MYLDLAANYLAIREGHLLSSEGGKGPEVICSQASLASRSTEWTIPTMDNIMSGRRCKELGKTRNKYRCTLSIHAHSPIIGWSHVCHPFTQTGS